MCLVSTFSQNFPIESHTITPRWYGEKIPGKPCLNGRLCKASAGVNAHTDVMVPAVNKPRLQYIQKKNDLIFS